MWGLLPIKLFMLSMTAQILTKVHTIFSNPRICGWSQKVRLDITLRKEGVVRKRKSLLNSPTTHQGKYFLWPEDALFLCNSLYFCCSIPGGYLRKISRSGEPQLIFNVQIYRKNALVYFTRQSAGSQWFNAYFAISQSLMVPKAEKTERMSSSVRSLWMLARYNLWRQESQWGCFQEKLHTCYILLPRSWSHQCRLALEASD